MPPITKTQDVKGNGMTNTVTYREFDYFGETRFRVIRIEAPVVRRRITVKRSKATPLCMKGRDGRCDLRYPEHTEGGHLIGLSLGGVDCEYNLVPMFAGFNQVLWKAIETNIYGDTSIVRMKVGLSYTAAEPRKPAQFWIHVQRTGSPAWVLYEVRHMMDQPQAYAFAIPDSARTALEAAQAAMEAEGWKAEDAGMDPGCLPDPAFRRYAVLDYLLIQQRDAFLGLVADLGLELGLPTIAKGMDFSELQKDLILRVNYSRGGAVRSDLHGLVLLQGSSTQAAHIDHMVSKTVSLGYNAFSNASVLSSMENTSKGAKHALEDGGGGGGKRPRASSSDSL